ncbi:MAG: tRNA uridine-5-carboxymethylaminomethyl(34) synthesis GTPase MnmE [Gammaproteobacteria bacterium]|nr:tRNA uridine-5-carboxymethylaminomethyl(34) synthesis GTPase MnmE [Gammaproteobacteria bacterium]MBU1624584.1 tRNA uridine-5-carboxymethylaminomethyl(34) synthesis GTPase MnmE [Gammaproteobacteria bacterium]MBU1982428.1 tRNA uridine-5-carboxymethylaminomethyl(34) synthesis GTPase MnmE [Gammaproteobacteria bacterium]
MLPKPDTIAAIATAPGQGGIGVVRVSGANLKSLSSAITGQELIPRIATYTPFLDESGETLDQGIALYFAAPNSFTGEEVVEFQGHGGPAVLQSVLHRCISLGARLAQPGEFSQRAFLNGKLDLAQAESIADLIAATTQQAAKSAVRSLSGEFSRAITRVLEKIIHLRAFVEATLDFPEEEGVVVVDSDRLLVDLSTLKGELEHIESLATQGNILREGAQVVLIGAPNAGKSSLLNQLSGEDVAMVSDIPGTTRDTIRQALQIDGIPIHLVDTAGIRETNDILEQMGIVRARQSIEKADLLILLIDESDATKAKYFIKAEINVGITPTIFVHNKIDLTGLQPTIEKNDGTTQVFLSAKTGAGVSLLKSEILNAVGWHKEEGVFMARSRHLDAISQALAALQGAEALSSRLELFAESLRLAQNELNQITGEFVADDLLGEIFGKFCIGK